MDIFGYTIDYAIIWIVIAVIFAIAEAITLGLTSIWFTAGGVAAAISAIAGAPTSVQVIIFLAVSILLLYFTKPLAQKKLRIGQEKTNVEAVVGQIAHVTEEIKPHTIGQVRIGGMVWTALSENNQYSLVKGTKVKVLRVEGVKLIVEPLDNEE